MVQPSRHPHARYRSGWVIPPAPVRPACHCLWFGRGSSTALRRSDILLCRRGPLRRTGDETPYLRSSRVPNRHSRSASKLAPRLCRCGPLPTLRNGVYRLALAAIGSFPFRGRPCCALPTSAVLGGASAILPPLAHRRPFRQLSEVLGQRGCAGADRACHPVHRACACPTSSSSIPTHSVCPSFA